MATNWTGVCDELTKISNPTLVITGTDDDVIVPTTNSLIITGKIPGTWLIEIKYAIEQYPDKVNRVLQSFLSTTNPAQKEKKKMTRNI